MGELAAATAVGGALGLLKQAEDEKRYRQQAKLAAAQTAVAPLIGSKIGQVGAAPSMFGNVLTGAIAGSKVGALGSMFGGGSSGGGAGGGVSGKEAMDVLDSIEM